MAFPGFLPPLVLTADDVGARHGEFGRQAYTDGGVYDNLGIRMFRFLDRAGPNAPPWDGVLAVGTSGQGDRQVHWEIGVDFRQVPPGESIDVIYEHTSPGLFLRDGVGSTTLGFEVELETAELTRWLLLPQGREYRSFQFVRHPTGKPESSEQVRLVTQYVSEDNSILAFKLLALKPGFTYEITWAYR